MSRYLEESYDKLLKENVELIAKIAIAEKMFGKILDERFITAPPEEMAPIYREIAIQALKQLRK